MNRENKVTNYFNYRLFPKIALGLPAVIFILDCIIRGQVFLEWTLPQIGTYILSLLTVIFFWLFFFYASTLLLKVSSIWAALFTFLVFFLEICVLILSYGFYNYFRGIPNYYVGEFIIQEPKDFYASVTGTITIWHWGILVIFTIGLSLFWIRQVKMNGTMKFGLQHLTTSLLLFLIGVFGLTKSSQLYDQAILPDLNAMILSSDLLINKLILKEKLVRSGLHESRRIPLAKEEQTVPVNILVILNESLRRQSLKPFGYRVDTTPFITRFIEDHPGEVFLFKKAYSNSTFTMLSVPSLMTGVSPVLPGTVLHKMPLIFDYGKTLDYSTFFISSQTFKWRNIGLFFENEPIDFYWNKDIGNAPLVHDIGTDDRLVVEKWRNYLKENPGELFTGVLQTYANHYPYFTRNKTADLYQRYDRSITYLDSIVAGIFTAMEENNLLNDTVVIFTSDHGEAFMEHGYSGHIRTYYEEESGIPLWIYIPYPIQEYYGNKIDFLKENTGKNVSNLDIIPTIIDLLNLKQLPDSLTTNLMGTSLLEPVDYNRPIYMLNNNEVSNYRIFFSLGVLKGDYKYLFIEDGGGPREAYYNLSEDPLEKNNLIDQHPEEIKRIYEDLWRFDAPRKILKETKNKRKISFY